jgi:hypothetical protein
MNLKKLEFSQDLQPLQILRDNLKNMSKDMFFLRLITLLPNILVMIVLRYKMLQ